MLYKLMPLCLQAAPSFECPSVYDYFIKWLQSKRVALGYSESNGALDVKSR